MSTLHPSQKNISIKKPTTDLSPSTPPKLFLETNSRLSASIPIQSELTPTITNAHFLFGPIFSLTLHISTLHPTHSQAFATWPPVTPVNTPNLKVMNLIQQFLVLNPTLLGILIQIISLFDQRSQNLITIGAFRPFHSLNPSRFIFRPNVFFSIFSIGLEGQIFFDLGIFL